MHLLINCLAILGGAHALVKFYDWSHDFYQKRTGRFTSPTRDSAKAQLRMEVLTIFGRAHIEVSDFDMQGWDRFVDQVVDATKEEITAEWGE